MKRNRKLLKVPLRMAETPRYAAEGIYVYPKTASFPIGDLYHARMAVDRVLSWPTLRSRRRTVIQAVQKHYPEYNWSVYWSVKRKQGKAKKDKTIQAWNTYLSKKKATAKANPYEKPYDWRKRKPRGLKYKVALAKNALKKAAKKGIIFPVEHKHETRYYVANDYSDAWNKITYDPPLHALIEYAFLYEPDDDPQEFYTDRDQYWLASKTAKRMGGSKKDFEKRLDQIIASVDKHLKNPRRRKNAGRRYDMDEYAMFILGTDNVPAKQKADFEETVNRALHESGWADVAQRENSDANEIYYLTLGSMLGEGVGLWEGRSMWHSNFENYLNTHDPRVKRAANRLQAAAQSRSNPKSNRRRTRRYALKNQSEASQAMNMYHANKHKGMTLKQAWAYVKNN